jgi:hypothetical protein
MKLCITFRRWHRQPRGHGPWPSCTKLLANSILSGPYNLRNLELEISGSLDEARSYFNHNSCKTDLLRADLEWNLAPLRALRGVNLTYCELLFSGIYGENDWNTLLLKKSVWPLESDAILVQQNTLKEVIRRFMEELVKEIA